MFTPIEIYKQRSVCTGSVPVGRTNDPQWENSSKRTRVKKPIGVDSSCAQCDDLASTQDDGCVTRTAGDDPGDVHGVHQRDETVSGQQAVSGLQGNNAAQGTRVPSGAARVRT